MESHHASALSLPAVIARFLTDELTMSVEAEPAPAVGFWLATSSNLTELINLDGLTQIAGSRLSQWYDAYAVATEEGQLPEALAKAWITRLCDDSLHLDGYEDAI